MNLRPLVASDIESVSRLISSLPLYQQYDFTLEKAKAALEKTLDRPDQEMTVAVEGDRVIGFSWFVKEGGFARSGYLRLIAVAPERQCSGVGRKMIEALEAKHLKPNGLFVLATKTNTHAREFYEKLGYACVGEIPNFVKKGLDEVIYYKSCPGAA